MSTIHYSRAPGANFDMIYPDHVPEVFADGLADVMFQGSHVRLAFYQNRPLDVVRMSEKPSPSDPLELRQVATFITMPVAIFVDSFSNVLRALAENYQTATPQIAAQIAQMNVHFEAIRSSNLGRNSTVRWMAPETVVGLAPAAKPRSLRPKKKPRTT